MLESPMRWCRLFRSHSVSLLLRTFFGASKWHFNSNFIVGTMIRDEFSYLEEWIEHYKAQGVKKIFVYDNKSTCNYREILNKYDNGFVNLISWSNVLGDAQTLAGQDFVKRNSRSNAWISFLDIDEFLWSRSGKLTDQLNKMPRYAACLKIKWTVFSPLVIDSSVTAKQESVKGKYKFRVVLDELSSEDKNYLSKPKWVCRAESISQFHVHHPVMRTGLTLYPEDFVLNHYMYRGLQDYERKLARLKSNVFEIQSAERRERYLRATYRACVSKLVFDNSINGD